MSRGGRPSARGAHNRNLIGPYEILEQLEAMGGVPDGVIEEMRRNPRVPNPRVEAANEEVVEALERAADRLTDSGVEHQVQGDRRGPSDPSPNAAMAREMAWIMSVTNSMKESAPRKNWCRHMRAADPHLGEIRTVAVLSAGIWQCVECLRGLGPERGLKALATNPWPDECDLCGTTMKAGHFNEIAFNIPGCMVNCTVCDRCADFVRERKAA